ASPTVQSPPTPTITNTKRLQIPTDQPAPAAHTFLANASSLHDQRVRSLVRVDAHPSSLLRAVCAKHAHFVLRACPLHTPYLRRFSSPSRPSVHTWALSVPVSARLSPLREERSETRRLSAVKPI
ncbi:hypothetical protein CF335_g9185, partial [Tilletia laevis]